ncbi:MAG: hypothetical protein FJ267_10645, partial [Planctomycetes bacterium]|nr:hypothetical protein [Planctomycetota bacterium]
MLVLFAATVWFSPAILVKTPLIHQLTKLACPTYPGAINLGDVSAGWLSPLVVQGFVAEDEEGHRLIEVSEIASAKKLWEIVTNWSDLGRFQLVEPIVRVSIRRDGSNIEDTLTKFFSGPQSSSPLPSFEVEVVRAKVELVDKSGSESSTIDNVGVQMTSIRGTITRLELSVGTNPTEVARTDGIERSNDSATETETETKTEAENDARTTADSSVQDKGSLKIVLSDETVPIQQTRQRNSASEGTRHAEFLAKRWDLTVLKPLLARIDSKGEIAGKIDADCRGEWTDASFVENCSFDLDVTAKGFVLTGLKGLHGDRLALQAVSSKGRCTLKTGQLNIESLKLTSDVGELTANGTFPWKEIESQSRKGNFRVIANDDDWELAGSIDLKRIAALFPHTLRIRDDAEITDGQF